MVISDHHLTLLALNGWTNPVWTVEFRIDKGVHEIYLAAQQGEKWSWVTFIVEPLTEKALELCLEGAVRRLCGMEETDGGDGTAVKITFV